jgi:hypothetical protein
MTYPDREEIQRWLEMSDFQLLTLIGEEISIPYGREAPPLYSKVARRWFSSFEIVVYGKLCIQNEICRKIDKTGFGDDISLVLAVGDMITGLLTGIPPFQVAAFLVKKGIRNLCHCGQAIDGERKKRYLQEAKSEINSLTLQLKELNKNDSKDIKEITRIKERLGVFIDIKQALSQKAKKRS